MKKYMLLLIIFSSVAISQPRWNSGETRPHRGRFDRDRIAEMLDLNQDQLKQFNKMQSELQKNRINVHSKIQTLRVELKDMMDGETPGKDQLESIMSEILKNQDQMRMQHIDFWFEVNKMLSAEQQKTWKEHLPSFLDGPKDRTEYTPDRRPGAGSGPHSR